MNTIRPLTRWHLVRYDDGQTTTLCGLPIVRDGKWPRLLSNAAVDKGVSMSCTTCERVHRAEMDDYAAEMVYENIVA